MCITIPMDVPTLDKQRQMFPALSGLSVPGWRERATVIGVKEFYLGHVDTNTRTIAPRYKGRQYVSVTHAGGYWYRIWSPPMPQEVHVCPGKAFCGVSEGFGTISLLGLHAMLPAHNDHASLVLRPDACVSYMCARSMLVAAPRSAVGILSPNGDFTASYMFVYSPEWDIVVTHTDGDLAQYELRVSNSVFTYNAPNRVVVSPPLTSAELHAALQYMRHKSVVTVNLHAYQSLMDEFSDMLRRDNHVHSAEYKLWTDLPWVVNIQRR